MSIALLQNLYTAVPCENPNDKLFFENPNLPRLNEDELEKLERPPTKEECFETLKLISKGKCPESDGFIVEFYLPYFWSILGEEMVQSFNNALIYGRLNITQRQGIIKVKPKKRKSKLYLENWRPISLLNIDYNIATKTIAGRISKVLPKLKHEDKIGYVKDHDIGQNIKLVQDKMKITSLKNIPGMAIFIDF